MYLCALGWSLLYEVVVLLVLELVLAKCYLKLNKLKAYIKYTMQISLNSLFVFAYHILLAKKI